MQFLTKQKIGALATAYFISSVICSPVLEAKDHMLDTRQSTPYMLWYSGENYTPATQTWGENEPAARRGKGDCQNLRVANKLRSAKAPAGWKCTLYAAKGCHGAKTKEFNSDGISSVPAIMSTWRCCELGKTNYWGYCDNKLNG